ncbi:MAG: hypothetical protein WCK27_11155 [Verrucomicrobiota bacterium]
MITAASVELYNALPQPLPVPDVPRGHPDFPMDAGDLINFSRCPRRWVLGTPPVLKPKVSCSEVTHLLALCGQLAVNTYAQRPADFAFTRLECTSCGSVSPSRVCRSCGLARTSKTDIRAWNGSSRFCTAWTAEQVSNCRRIVPAEVWERAAAASTAISNDRVAAAFINSSVHQVELSGKWLDPATNRAIPLRTVLSCVPDPYQGIYGDCLGSLVLTYDASSPAWDSPAMNRSAHIVAALKQQLHNFATNEDRQTHCWIIVEKLPPHLVARRRTTPLLLGAGNAVLSQIFSDYAHCLDTGIWPSFDSDSDLPSEAFTPVTFEPWMALPPTSGNTPSYESFPEHPET